VPPVTPAPEPARSDSPKPPNRSYMRRLVRSRFSPTECFHVQRPNGIYCSSCLGPSGPAPFTNLRPRRTPMSRRPPHAGNRAEVRDVARPIGTGAGLPRSRTFADHSGTANSSCHYRSQSQRQLSRVNAGAESQRDGNYHLDVVRWPSLPAVEPSRFVQLHEGGLIRVTSSSRAPSCIC
jgi:hypothetical protein